MRPAILLLAAVPVFAQETPLLNGRDLSGWHAKDPSKPHEWLVKDGVTMNGLAGKTQDWISDQTFGDVELYVEWMVPKGSNSGVYLHGLYEVQIFDSYGKANTNYSDAGGIYHRWIDNRGVGGSSPKVNASRPPGEWQWFRIWFRAPRFDAGGKKTENAKFIKVIYNGQLVQENVEVDGPTRSGLDIPEASRNPLMLQGDHGPVSFRKIAWRPLP